MINCFRIPERRLGCINQQQQPGHGLFCHPVTTARTWLILSPSKYPVLLLGSALTNRQLKLIIPQCSLPPRASKMVFNPPGLRALGSRGRHAEEGTQTLGQHNHGDGRYAPSLDKWHTEKNCSQELGHLENRNFDNVRW
jgi:hypothetical protein